MYKAQHGIGAAECHCIVVYGLANCNDLRQTYLVETKDRYGRDSTNFTSVLRSNSLAVLFGLEKRNSVVSDVFFSVIQNLKRFHKRV